MFINAALVVVGVLVLLDLLLTFGVIRRLRDHTEQLRRMQLGPEVVIAGKGAKVGDFATTTTDGEALSANLLTGETLVGFFSPGCQPCETLLPAFVDYAATMPGGRDHVLAVVATDTPEASDVTEKVAALSPYARTVVAAHEEPVLKAFGVNGYPGVLLVQDGTVVASGGDLDALPARLRV